MKKLALFSIALMFVSLVGCGGSDEAQIKKLVGDMVDATNNFDGEKLIELMYFETEAEKNMAKMGIAFMAMFKAAFEGLDKKMIESWELKDLKIEGDKATGTMVTVTNQPDMMKKGEFKTEEQSKPVMFKKVDGKWYIFEEKDEASANEGDENADETTGNGE